MLVGNSILRTKSYHLAHTWMEREERTEVRKRVFKSDNAQLHELLAKVQQQRNNEPPIRWITLVDLFVYVSLLAALYYFIFYHYKLQVLWK